MKKRNLLIFSSLSLVAASVALASVGLLKSRTSKISVAKADAETYIPMESSFFTNWTNDAGSFAGTDARFWGENYSFEALDTFFRGESAETWTGTLTSRTWKQSTQYVYFQFGGARDYDHPEGAVHLVFHYGAYADDYYNNTFVENPMTLRYFKVPDERFAALTASEDDFDMYIEIVDPCTAGYGFANFGYLHVNQTLESTSNAMRYYLNHLNTDNRDWENNKRKEILNSYYNNASQREVFLATVNNADEDFESGSDFLNHWYFDHNYFNNDGTARYFDNAISTASARTAETSNMPYNKTGNGLFKGWYDGAEAGGFTATDGAVYRFVSRPFVLSGNGLISIKMAGRSASLHVIDAATQSDLAWIDVRTYNGEGGQNNIARGGMNTVTMVRHYINLEAYLGRTIQLAIADIYDSGWAASYFDELITKYTSYPALHVDFVTQTNEVGTFYATYLDQYISSVNITADASGVKYNGDNDINKANDNAILNHADTTAAKDAYNFARSFIGFARDNSRGTSMCSVITSDDMKAFITSYNGLSVAAQKIVCASDDYQRPEATSENWDTIAPTKLVLGQTLEYIAGYNKMAITTYTENSLGLFPWMNNSGAVAAIILVFGTVLIFSFAGFLFIKRRRKENN